MARIAEVTCLVIGDSIKAMDSHGTSILFLMSGADQVYAGSGPNPRDTEGETSGGRGERVPLCHILIWEVECGPSCGPAASLQGPLRQGEGTNDITATTFEGR